MIDCAFSPRLTNLKQLLVERLSLVLQFVFHQLHVSAQPRLFLLRMRCNKCNSLLRNSICFRSTMTMTTSLPRITRPSSVTKRLMQLRSLHRIRGYSLNTPGKEVISIGRVDTRSSHWWKPPLHAYMRLTYSQQHNEFQKRISYGTKKIGKIRLHFYRKVQPNQSQ